MLEHHLNQHTDHLYSAYGITGLSILACCWGFLIYNLEHFPHPQIQLEIWKGVTNYVFFSLFTLFDDLANETATEIHCTDSFSVRYRSSGMYTAMVVCQSYMPMKIQTKENNIYYLSILKTDLCSEQHLTQTMLKHIHKMLSRYRIRKTSKIQLWCRF